MDVWMYVCGGPLHTGSAVMHIALLVKMLQGVIMNDSQYRNVAASPNPKSSPSGQTADETFEIPGPGLTSQHDPITSNSWEE